MAVAHRIIEHPGTVLPTQIARVPAGWWDFVPAGRSPLSSTCTSAGCFSTGLCHPVNECNFSSCRMLFKPFASPLNCSVCCSVLLAEEQTVLGICAANGYCLLFPQAGLREVLVTLCFVFWQMHYRIDFKISPATVALHTDLACLIFL